MRRTGLVFRAIYGPTSNLMPWEEEMLAAVQIQLKEQTAAKLAKQLLLLPYRQRQNENRVLAFFPDQGNLLPEEVLFSRAQEQLAFATANIDFIASQALSVTFYAATRRLFSIDYSDSPRLTGAEVDNKYKISNVTVIVNPDE